MIASGKRMFSVRKVPYQVLDSIKFKLDAKTIIAASFSHHVHDKDIFSQPLKYETKIPQSPTSPIIYPEQNRNLPKAKIDEATLKQLQRWSLVKLEDDEALKTLENAIDFANKIFDVCTDDVEPMYTVLESRNLQLRNDLVFEGNCRDDILCNAHLKEENYFVAPPGNISLAGRK